MISTPSSVSSQIFPVTTSLIYSTTYCMPILTPHDLGVYVYPDHIFGRVCDVGWNEQERGHLELMCLQSQVYNRILPLTAACVTASRSCTLSGSVSSWVEAVCLCVCGRWGLVDSVNFMAFVSLQFSEVILCGKSDFHRRSISGN